MMKLSDKDQIYINQTRRLEGMKNNYTLKPSLNAQSSTVPQILPPSPNIAYQPAINRTDTLIEGMKNNYTLKSRLNAQSSTVPQILTPSPNLPPSQPAINRTHTLIEGMQNNYTLKPTLNAQSSTVPQILPPLSYIAYQPAEELEQTIAQPELKFFKELELESLAKRNNTVSSLVSLTYDQIYKKLLEFLNNHDGFDDIVNWIYVNVGKRSKEKEFIRVLATAVFKNSIIELNLYVETFRKHYDLINHFVDKKPDYELEVLYALQAYINTLGVPQGLYMSAFSTLYDDNVLSHDSFLKWESSTDPAEQNGKDVALEE